jgi:aryl-alcohol dehydrogenase-like predicted oxidoreductase
MTAMQYAQIPGVATPSSRLVLGVDNQHQPEHAAIFDRWFEAGGRTFDTGWLYGGGVPERLLGSWLASTGVRDDVVIIDKVAHTPHDNPSAVAPQVAECLERLGTDHIDLLLLHRDNEGVPVDEWVSALDEERRAGRVTAYGGSNWSTTRVDEANACAARMGAPAFAGLSNNLSLARMLDVIWAGCVTMSDEDRAWAESTQTPILPWSSQGRGFFTELAGRHKEANPEIVRVWYSDDNFARKDRAAKLAADRGVAEINIALAWVLAQPFPTFPLIGPRTPEELASSLGALDVELTPAEVAWLDLRS